ncbi:MAG: phosphate/phosphite/phosphonate ABC transporter substrate-binding protein [Pseudomonadota bacterium]
MPKQVLLTLRLPPRLLLRQLLALMLCMAAAMSAASMPRVLVMGVISDNPSDDIARLKPMAAYVQTALASTGIENVEVLVVPDRNQMINLLRDGRIDWVSETAFGAIYLQERANARLLTRKWKDGAATYRSIFFARKDSPVNEIIDLRDRVLAFEHRNSTSAFFMPASIMSSMSLPLESLSTPRETPRDGSFGYVYSGNEYNTAIWVHKGLVDAGVLSNTDWQNTSMIAPEIIADLKVFARSDELPRAIEVVRGDLDAELVARLRNILQTMHTDPEAADALAAYHNTTRFDELSEDDRLTLASIGESLPAFAEQFP